MARVYDLAAETSRLYEQYLELHHEVFGFSLRDALGFGSGNKPARHAHRVQRLQSIETRVAEIRREVGELDDGELTKRSKEEVRSALVDYAGALQASILRLRDICTSLQHESEGADGYGGYSEQALRTDKIGYDDSIQACKRLGARLTDLIAKI